MENIVEKVTNKLTRFADKAGAGQAWENKVHIAGTKHISPQGYMTDVMQEEGYPSHLIVHKDTLDEKEYKKIERKAKKIYIDDYVNAKDLERKLEKLFGQLKSQEITLKDYGKELENLNVSLENGTQSAFDRLEYYAKMGAKWSNEKKAYDNEQDDNRFRSYQRIFDNTKGNA
jgi:hypothetical protein